MKPFEAVDCSRMMRCEIDAAFELELALNRVMFGQVPKIVGLIQHSMTLEGYQFMRHIERLRSLFSDESKIRLDRQIMLHDGDVAQALISTLRAYYMNGYREELRIQAGLPCLTRQKWDARKERMALREACHEPASKPKKAGRL